MSFSLRAYCSSVSSSHFLNRVMWSGLAALPRLGVSILRCACLVPNVLFWAAEKRGEKGTPLCLAQTRLWAVLRAFILFLEAHSEKECTSDTNASIEYEIELLCVVCIVSLCASEHVCDCLPPPKVLDKCGLMLDGSIVVLAKRAGPGTFVVRCPAVCQALCMV
jgi:hypothetical protein